MTRTAATLSTVVATVAFGLVSAGPAAAKSKGGADSETVEPATVEETVQQSGGTAADAAEQAVNQVDKPYRYGAAGPDAFDCSGLVQWVYKKAGKNIDRTTHGQINEGTSVNRSDLEVGDLVFFYSGPGHVGIYVGDEKMVHAPSSGKGVEIVDMADYWENHYVGARRIA